MSSRDGRDVAEKMVQKTCLEISDDSFLFLRRFHLSSAQTGNHMLSFRGGGGWGGGWLPLTFPLSTALIKAPV